MDTPTPVFLHGYSGDGASLGEFAAACFPDDKPVCVDLPGFGANPLKNSAAEIAPLEYLEETWRAVCQAVPEGKIHLVGHSYGAVLAFALAAAHPEVVTRVDLFTPGVYPKPLSYVGLIVARLFSDIPGGLQLFTWVFQHRVFVDAVTRSMEYDGWPEARKQRIRAMRRKEAKAYSPQMLRLSLHALRMPKALDGVRCTVPVRIVQARDDTVTEMKSAKWIEQRSDIVSVATTHGGHLGIVAEPERLARLLYGAS